MQTTIIIVAIIIFFIAFTLKQNKFLSPARVTEKVAGGALIVDVRTPAEFVDGHVLAAKNYPLQSLSSQLSKLPKDNDIIVYCLSGNRSSQAIMMLKQAGFTRVFNAGGYERVKGIIKEQ